MKKNVVKGLCLCVVVALLSFGLIGCDNPNGGNKKAKTEQVKKTDTSKKNNGSNSGNSAVANLFSESTEDNEIPEKNSIICEDDNSVAKISFSSDGKKILFPGYKDAEKELGYAPSIQNKMRWYKRFFHVLDVKWDKGKTFWVIQPETNKKGKILWLLYLADFFNVYQEKAPAILDMANAPKWFTELMKHRKTLSKKYRKSDYDLDVKKLYFEGEVR